MSDKDCARCENSDTPVMDVQDDAKHAMCSETKREDSVQAVSLEDFV